ncbi:MAG: hypothetical protein FWE42_06550, partial [Defluviitaleaceae bacterium]|nr:hypothetical protein [Defluviitaleaceae bacterium]
WQQLQSLLQMDCVLIIFHGKTSLHKGWSAFGKNDTGACFPETNPVYIRAGALSSKMTSAHIFAM